MSRVVEQAQRKRPRMEGAGQRVAGQQLQLDRKNPRGKVDFEHLSPEQLADDILKKDHRIAELMIEIKAVLAEKP